MDIAQLMKRFEALGGTEIGQGPKHSEQPNLIIAPDVRAFLDAYPILKRDPGYVDFLEVYAGASLTWSNDALAIDIFGFTSVSSHLVLADGPLVDGHGFLKFCDSIVRVQASSTGLKDVLGQGFAFDVTGERKWGIYRSITNDQGESPPIWYCSNFLTWLQMMIETRGKLSET